jgi:hypothetical protein
MIAQLGANRVHERSAASVVKNGMTAIDDVSKKCRTCAEARARPSQLPVRTRSLLLWLSRAPPAARGYAQGRTGEDFGVIDVDAGQGRTIIAFAHF